jgi:hypothetical protein
MNDLPWKEEGKFKINFSTEKLRSKNISGKQNAKCRFVRNVQKTLSLKHPPVVELQVIIHQSMECETKINPLK